MVVGALFWDDPFPFLNQVAPVRRDVCKSL